APRRLLDDCSCSYRSRCARWCLRLFSISTDSSRMDSSLIALLREYYSGMLAAMYTIHPQFRLIDQRIPTRCADFVQSSVGDHEVRSDSIKLFDPAATL